MDDLAFWPPSWSMLLLLPALFVGFTVHELAHATVAFLLGDTSQVERKRLSLNPLRHVSWIGLVVFLLFGFGWAKPVRVDARRFRAKNQAFAMFVVSVAGASANLVTGLVALAGIALTMSIVWTSTGASPLDVWQFLLLDQPALDAHGVAVALSGNMMKVNLLLAFFNLLPVPPLDGFQALISLVAAIRTGLGRGPARGPALRPVRPTGVRDQTGGEHRTGEPQDGDAAAAASPAQIHFAIGLEYQKDGQLDEAIARYRQATDHDENFGLAYYNLGVAYWAKGRIPLAISAFRAARASPDEIVQVHASRSLRELLLAEHNAGAAVGAPPAPLEPDAGPEQKAEGLRSLDPAVTRRVWISLAAGGAGLVLLAVVAWFYVTSVALTMLGGMGLL
jgi:Zn-dependent protease